MGMTKRNQLGSALGGGDSGDTRDFERIAFGRFEAPHAFDGRLLHAHEGVGDGGARGGGLRGYVHHPHAAFFIVVRELFHRAIVSKSDLA